MHKPNVGSVTSVELEVLEPSSSYEPESVMEQQTSESSTRDDVVGMKMNQGEEGERAVEGQSFDKFDKATQFKGNANQVKTTRSLISTASASNQLVAICKGVLTKMAKPFKQRRLQEKRTAVSKPESKLDFEVMSDNKEAFRLYIQSPERVNGEIYSDYAGYLKEMEKEDQQLQAVDRDRSKHRKSKLRQVIEGQRYYQNVKKNQNGLKQTGCGPRYRFSSSFELEDSVPSL